MRKPAGVLVGAAPAAVCLVLLFLGGCARRPEPAASHPARRAAAFPLAVDVFADTGRGGRLEVRPPAARVWLASVTPARAPVPEVPLPEALPDSLPPPEDAPPALAVDPGLKPPVLRAPGSLQLPPGWSGPPESVELDVRVDESGRVSDALPAAGDADPVLVESARRCALGMRFYPALRAGRPVAVWCRQRFDLGGERR
jgi:hypothetical protein